MRRTKLDLIFSVASEHSILRCGRLMRKWQKSNEIYTKCTSLGAETLTVLVTETGCRESPSTKTIGRGMERRDLNRIRRASGRPHLKSLFGRRE